MVSARQRGVSSFIATLFLNECSEEKARPGAFYLRCHPSQPGPVFAHTGRMSRKPETPSPRSLNSLSPWGGERRGNLGTAEGPCRVDTHPWRCAGQQVLGGVCPLPPPHPSSGELWGHPGKGRALRLRLLECSGIGVSILRPLSFSLLPSFTLTLFPQRPFSPYLRVEFFEMLNLILIRSYIP